MKLADRHCVHGAPALDEAALAPLLAQLPAWRLVGTPGGKPAGSPDGKPGGDPVATHLERDYAFRDYHETIAFVNALAWMIHAQDHHPDLTVRYRHCLVAYTTHSAGHMVSLNDFVCAAKADAIYEERTHA